MPQTFMLFSLVYIHLNWCGRVFTNLLNVLRKTRGKIGVKYYISLKTPPTAKTSLVYLISERRVKKQGRKAL